MTDGATLALVYLTNHIKQVKVVGQDRTRYILRANIVWQNPKKKVNNGTLDVQRSTEFVNMVCFVAR